MRKLCLPLALVCACAGSPSHDPNVLGTKSSVNGNASTAGSGASGSMDGDRGATASGGSAANGGASTGTTSGGASATAGGTCAATPMLSALGKDHFLIGFTRESHDSEPTPFDLRYEYLSAGLPDNGAPCSDCSTCKTGGGSGWWGCYDSAPGGYVQDFIARAHPQIPMLTYYEIYQTMTNIGTPGNASYRSDWAGYREGADEVNRAVSDLAFMRSYFLDWRFVLTHVGDSVALLHIEPDFWGFAEQANHDPHALPAAVASANPTDCADQENTVAGLGRCMIAMVRKYAPHALVSLHASAWAAGDPLGNSSPSYDGTADAAQTATFLAACGAGNSDFIVADMANADAGYYEHFLANSSFSWDAANTTLPNFHQGWKFGQDIAQGVGKPLLWWQVPVGNASLTESVSSECDSNRFGSGTAAFKDNRVDYVFAHVPELVASGAIGVAFGPGLPCDTTVDNDGGNLRAKTQAYADAGGAPACP